MLLRVRVRALRGRAILNNEGHFQPTRPLNFKSIRGVQQQYKIAVQPFTYHKSACVPPFQVATPPAHSGISSQNHIPKGNLVYYMYLFWEFNHPTVLILL